MQGYIDGTNFHDLAAMKYYAPPASWTEEKKKETAISRIFSNQWVGAVKRDGAFYKFVKDETGYMELLGRSKGVEGDYLNKIEWLPQLMPFFNSLPIGTCLLGEVVAPHLERSTETTKIMGCALEKAVSRQEKNGYAKYYIFDALAWNGKSLIDTTISDRVNLLENYLSKVYQDNEYVEFAHYCRGEELWETLQVTLANGGEGIVITRDDCPYKPGKRSTKDTLKVKKELRETIDCVIIGAEPPTKEYTGKNLSKWVYWENSKTEEKLKLDERVPLVGRGYVTEGYKRYYEGLPLSPITKMYFLGGAGSLKIGLYKDGKMTQLGTVSGIEEDVLLNWKDYVGRVVEISAMEIMDESLRHPRLLRIREPNEKSAKECVWSQLYS